MSLKLLKNILCQKEPLRQIRKLLDGDAGPIAVEEIASEVKPLLASCVATDQKSVTAIVAYSEEEAERLWEGLLAYGLEEERLFLIPAAESLLFCDGAPDWNIVGARVRALTQLALGRGGVLILPLSAALMRTCLKSDFAAAIQQVEVGAQLDIHKLATTLAITGYRRADLVTETGQFAIRGGLLDIWPPTENSPVRIELFDDEVESIRPFDPETQRSGGSLPEVVVPPGREVLIGERGERAADLCQERLDEQIEKLRNEGRAPDAEALELRVSEHISSLRQGASFDGLEYYLPFLVSEESCLLDWLPANAVILWDEPGLSESGWDRLREELTEIYFSRAERGQALAAEHERHVSLEHARQSMLKRRCVVMSSLPNEARWLSAAQRISLPSSGMETFGAQVGVFAENAKKWISHDLGVVVVTPQVLRVGQMLLELDVRPVHGELRGEVETGVTVIEGSLPAGYRLPGAGVVVVADADIFGAAVVRRPRMSRRDARPIASISDIKAGDYIVHVHHGIGVYRGMANLNGRDFLFLEYAGGDKLYVPADQMDRVQKYSSAEAIPPTVHRLGGSDWARTKKKVKASVREMAKELLQVYAAREALGGYGFPPDTPWQREMEQAFPFTETGDQERAIEDVKRDLQETRPMDRLICGDVGFGKTEVAMRAAFKVVLDGKQVAVLCPTTVLAQQHFNVFSERLAAFPVKVEMLSRFRSAKEQQAILEELRAGNVDIVIGTHRLLSKDVEFKNLGLVVVDEEQRFGVSHKERLKQMRLSVDVLTLTATPIPRTLHMSLAGIRDMSVVNEAPEGRIPVRTYVREFDDNLVREAIVRELDRDGQIFVVHNRVESIGQLADRIARLVPHARIAIGHGQMSEHELERVMLDFYHNKFDVLVSTTIIESGLDIPNANTIIVNNADKFGLAQLYQLRGRVGRSPRQAYAYLLYKSDLVLSEVAEKRLAAIREFADLGSGFKIAMRDLEIRGAGNILGAEQHGQMLSVGFDMYCHLLAQAVKELKGEELPEEKALPPADISVEAFIPTDYVSNEGMRISLYRRMSSLVTEEAAVKLEEELADRFGALPDPVRNALALLKLRIECDRVGVQSVREDNGRIVVSLGAGVSLPPEAIRQLKKAFPEHIWEPRQVRLLAGKSSPLDMVSEFLRLARKALNPSSETPKRRPLTARV